jgi:DNA-binding GntR family transcriptional regulator
VRDAFKTATQKAYEAITHAILARALAPGQKLTRRGMAELTGVSTIAVTEALHRLEAEGLVESRPHLGARVVALDDDVLRDRFQLREAIECHVARILALQMTESQAAEARDLARTIDRYAEHEESHQIFWDRHYDFHLKLAEFTTCRSLVDALKKIGFFLLLQRAHMMVHLADRNRHEDHVSIVEAIMTRDPDTAERTMRSHIRTFPSTGRERRPLSESRVH